jgi:hypothetical protein
MTLTATLAGIRYKRRIQEVDRLMDEAQRQGRFDYELAGALVLLERARLAELNNPEPKP